MLQITSHEMKPLLILMHDTLTHQQYMCFGGLKQGYGSSLDKAKLYYYLYMSDLSDSVYSVRRCKNCFNVHVYIVYLLMQIDLSVLLH